MTRLTTRRFLQLSGALFAGALLAACGKKEEAAPASEATPPAATAPAAEPTTAPTTAPTEAPATGTEPATEQPKQ